MSINAPLLGIFLLLIYILYFIVFACISIKLHINIIYSIIFNTNFIMQMAYLDKYSNILQVIKVALTPIFRSLSHFCNLSPFISLACSYKAYIKAYQFPYSEFVSASV